MTQLPTPKKMRGPFKPSFGLSGVVADPTLRSVSLGVKPRNLQFPLPSIECLRGETVLFIRSEAEGSAVHSTSVKREPPPVNEF
jgi:hypothetical protein